MPESVENCGWEWRGGAGCQGDAAARYHAPVLEPCLAPVRPRVRAPGGGEALLEELVADALARPARAWFALRGPPGAGKSAALAHLAARFAGESRLILLDGEHLRTAPGPRWPPVVVSVGLRGRTRPIGLELLPWAEDDCIEYLLERHAAQCGSVVARLRVAKDLLLLDGLPALLAPALDALAADEGLTTMRAALRSAITSRVESTAELAEVRRACAHRLLRNFPIGAAALARDVTLRRLADAAVVQVLCVADQLVADLLADPPAFTWLQDPPPVAVLREAGAALRGHRAARAALRSSLGRGPNAETAWVASLLVASGDPWVPSAQDRLELAGAYLVEAQWPQAHLEGVKLRRADLRRANLADADCTRASFMDADLTAATIEGAVLDWATLERARLAGANGRLLSATQGRFRKADLSWANLEGASLPHADLRFCSLAGVCLDRADLRDADLHGARLDRASFLGADLRRVTMPEADLRSVSLDGARLEGARLQETDWSGLRVAGLRLDGAHLQRADLTGAAFPAARMRGATLFGARLADVDLSRADLRGADLRSASFQMGSSRSGLVGSPIAREGSLTGFYTEDLRETAHLFPEEVRKADLSGCDLRGARLDGTDFYLVDLRGALYDDEQADYLRQCGAILDALASPP